MCSFFGPRYHATVSVRMLATGAPPPPDGHVTFWDTAVLNSSEGVLSFRMPVSELLLMFADITRKHRQEQVRKDYVDPAMA